MFSLSVDDNFSQSFRCVVETASQTSYFITVYQAVTVKCIYDKKIAAKCEKISFHFFYRTFFTPFIVQSEVDEHFSSSNIAIKAFERISNQGHFRLRPITADINLQIKRGFNKTFSIDYLLICCGG